MIHVCHSLSQEVMNVCSNFSQKNIKVCSSVSQRNYTGLPLFEPKKLRSLYRSVLKYFCPEKVLDRGFDTMSGEVRRSPVKSRSLYIGDEYKIP